MNAQTEKIKKSISQIDWSVYETAYGNAAEKHSVSETGMLAEQMLCNLFSEDFAVAMRATHDLWCSLCHQHAFISSAALPAYDFLVMRLKNSDEQLKVEILDILYGFSALTVQSEVDWQVELRAKLRADLEYFQSLTASDHEDVAGFAQCIVDELER